jgi:hypothetical protein
MGKCATLSLTLVEMWNWSEQTILIKIVPTVAPKILSRWGDVGNSLKLQQNI